MERERITISIKKAVLDAVDKTIDGGEIRNRSHAIETLLNKSLSNINSSSTVLLLGGDNAIKAIPAAQSFLEILRSSQFKTVNIAVGFLGNKIKGKLGEGDSEIEISYSDKGEGSGGALLGLKNKLTGTFIIWNSQKKIDVDLDFLFEYHKKHNALVTIATNDLDSLSGVYICEQSVLKMIPKGFSMFEEDILPKLIEKGDAIIFPL